MFGLFKKKNNGGSPSDRELKKRVFQLKSKRINCVYVDFDDLTARMNLDPSVVSELSPVNYYALKSKYIEAHYFYSEDYSECYVKLTACENDKAFKESGITAIPTEALIKAFAKVGVIIKLQKPENEVSV